MEVKQKRKRLNDLTKVYCCYLLATSMNIYIYTPSCTAFDIIPILHHIKSQESKKSLFKTLCSLWFSL